MKKLTLLVLVFSLTACGTQKPPKHEIIPNQGENIISNDNIVLQAERNTALENLYLLNAKGINHSVNELEKRLATTSDISDENIVQELNEVLQETIANPENRASDGMSIQQLYSYSSMIPQEAAHMNPYEKQLCDQNAWRCAQFLQAGYLASSYSGTDLQWQNYGINNEKDAFRHSLWNAIMTLSIGYNDAKAFADAHEYGSPSQVQGGVGQQMDFHNNAVGRNVAAYLPRDQQCALGARSALHKEMRNGRLRIVHRINFWENVDERVGNTRYLVSSNTWSAYWPASYIDLINRPAFCYLG